MSYPTSRDEQAAYWHLKLQEPDASADDIQAGPDGPRLDRRGIHCTKSDVVGPAGQCLPGTIQVVIARAADQFIRPQRGACWRDTAVVTPQMHAIGVNNGGQAPIVIHNT